MVLLLSLWVQQVVRAAGEGAESRLYSAHSMRIGGATELHAVGANELTISLLGRWSSDCWRLYVRACFEQTMQWTRRLGSQQVHDLNGEYEEAAQEMEEY